MIKAIMTGLNLAIALNGLFLVRCMLHTYDNPIPLGCLFVILLCAKSCMEVIQK